ncbi:MAG: hypothetical protein MUD05_06965 [Candidatus Nanopelagicales bacterium]|jgi:hypothetical protein|nr:hypothetical protein [Candidatus Nanopelagicales bacterium]
MRERMDVTGAKYGKLTVLRHLPNELHATRMRRMVECQCECGAVVKRVLINLRAVARHGNPACSIGCAHRGLKSGNYRHGKSRDASGKPSREYRAWNNLRARCYQKNHVSFAHYGGRGVTVCDRWRTSFENFFADMGEAPAGKRISIDRIDPNRGYEPGNCRWATPRQQANNRRKPVKRYELDGVHKTLTEWAEHFGTTYAKVAQRLRQGWGLHAALTTPSIRRPTP